jgi:hypothetical protein
MESWRQPWEFPIFCLELASLQRAVKRARTMPLNLHINTLDGSFQTLGLSFNIRCRQLSFDSGDGGEAVLPFLGSLPLLEHLELNVYTWSVANRLLNVIETGSPLLWSLTTHYANTSCTYLERFPSLLTRIRRFDYEVPFSAQFTDGVVIGLQNLTELM